MKIADELYKAVEFLIDKKLSELRFDRTVEGKIVKQTEDGYLVAIEGIKITAKTKSDHNIGSSVRVHIPQNNINNAYID